MAKTIQRLLGPVERLDRAQYTTWTASERPAMCCPECGEVSEIELPVLPGGRVLGAWACPQQGCAYMAFLELEGWNEPEPLPPVPGRAA